MEKSKIFLLVDATSVSSIFSLQQFPATYRHNFNGYPHIFDNARPEYDVVYYGFKMAACEPELEITFLTVGDRNASPKVAHAPTFSFTPDFDLTLPDDGRR